MSHRVVVDVVYDFRLATAKNSFSSGPLSYVLGNWRVPGIYNNPSGAPFTMTVGARYSTDLHPFSAHTAVPNATGTPIAVQSADCWF
jgi:hypothetical protein